VNKVILTGHVGRDPELKYNQEGKAIANYSLATDESYKDKNGQKVEKTEWHRIVAFGRTAEVIGEYVTKGKKLLVEGKLQTRSWDDDKGNKRYMTEIVQDRMEFLGGGNGSNGSNQGSGSNGARQQSEPPQENSSENYGTSGTENLPF
jgi:single-strand DNA-binding protein